MITSLAVPFPFVLAFGLWASAIIDAGTPGRKNGVLTQGFESLSVGSCK
jgi:hypothetical protein